MARHFQAAEDIGVLGGLALSLDRDVVGPFRVGARAPIRSSRNSGAAIAGRVVLHNPSSAAALGHLGAVHTRVSGAKTARSSPAVAEILGDPGLLGKPVGQETVNGIATTKYDVDEKTPQGRAVGSLWLSQEGIPMKGDATLATDKG